MLTIRTVIHYPSPAPRAPLVYEEVSARRIYWRERRRAALDDGFCGCCRAKEVVEGRSRCIDCMEYDRKRNQRNRGKRGR